MKKLSLKQLNLEPGALLQKEQLKTVFGGYDDVCIDDCSDYGKSCTDSLGRSGKCKKYQCNGTNIGYCKI